MQMSLLHESINDALRDDITAAGGFKSVGAMLWPELPVDQAAGKLRDCNNPVRREHLTPEQLQLVVRLARAKAGVSAVLTFMCRDGGFSDPVPVEPEDEVARLQREFIAATQQLTAMAAKIEAAQVRSRPVISQPRGAA